MSDTRTRATKKHYLPPRSARFERFTDEEAPLLNALPDEAFEHVEWKQAKVGRNYHATVDYQHYSVPGPWPGSYCGYG